MRSRRMSVIVASVAVPVLMLAATSCSSGDKSSSTNAIADTTATLGKYAITNNVDPCWLALRSITDLLNDNPRKGKRQAFPVSVAPVEPNGERRCVYDGGVLTVSTYVEKKNSNKLYNAVLEARTGAMSKHAIGGEIATKAAGMWITFHGQLVGGVFQPKHSGVTVVLQAPPGSIFGREQLNSVAMQATDDVINGTAEDDMS